MKGPAAVNNCQYQTDEKWIQSKAYTCTEEDYSDSSVQFVDDLEVERIVLADQSSSLNSRYKSAYGPVIIANFSEVILYDNYDDTKVTKRRLVSDDEDYTDSPEGSADSQRLPMKTTVIFIKFFSRS